ncbi:hypothetical protein SOVF_193320 [Spinacia oleracea]|nr:hypothetical protein SOVF_193320 [Spinacia oleracea]
MSSSIYMLYCMIFCFHLSASQNNETERLSLLEIKGEIRNDPLGVIRSWNDSYHFCEWYGVTCGRTYEQVMELDLNSLELAGTLSSHVGNLSFLRVLRLDNNNFVGMIPNSLGKLRSLTILFLEDNMLYGIVPPSIFNLSSLTQLSLRQNDLEGNLPSDLGNTLPGLTFLSLGSNRFTGLIPASISNLSNLQILQLGRNHLRGQVPSLHNLLRLIRLSLSDNSLGNGQRGDLNFVSSIPNVTHLDWLQIDQNNFRGIFPTAICNFSSLTRLVLYRNNIAGEIPSCIGNLARLQNFVANDNALSGVIPSSIGNLRDLYLLYLNGNQLSGNIPSSIGNLTRLSMFSLSHNRVTGQIPSFLGSCTSLSAIYFANNSLTSRIPLHLFNLPALSTMLDLSENRLTGPLPEQVGRLSNLQTILLNGNMLSGSIPSSLSSCISLEYLYLGNNSFQNSIPDSLRLLRGLIEIDLSYNSLSGQIPQFLATLQLRLLNLSHNNLQGQVPIHGVFANETAVLVGGNTRLCGGIVELMLPPCNVSTNSNTPNSNQRRLIIIILSTFAGVILLLAFVFLLLHIFCKKKKSEEPMPFGYSENFPSLSYQTLLKATNGFSPENLIGSGTFGVVYKGILEENGSTVAIKIFNLEYHGALKGFVAECEVLRSIRHRNLLKVITACSSIDYQGRDFKALVCEYMVNGSLDNWLHSPLEITEIEGTYETSRYLNLRQRLDIAVDIAFSLDYLHNQYGAPIVHCDLKPSNILLDHELVAHVGDFGLAKILIQGINNSYADQSTSIGVRGTIGYTPPEYGLGNEVSTTGDVYSFGILLLEMFTGKRPTNDMFKGSLSLHSFAKKAIPGEVTTIVDKTLLEDIDKEDKTTKSVMLEVLVLILGVAISCSTDVPQERLDMSDVAANLSLIRSKFLDNQGDFKQV